MAHHLPDKLRTNADLAALNPGWSDEVIYRKTGIRSRPIADDDETALDLGCIAAEKLLRQGDVERGRIDALILVTQSPEYLLPPGACLMQQRLGLSTSTACFDVNLGCSGFVYGLWLARSLILSSSARQVLLVCAETYSRYCDVHDLSTVTLFGDGAAAALVGDDARLAWAEIGPALLGTDGTGARNLIVPNGGARLPDAPGRKLEMNGPEVFRFALDRIRPACEELLAKVRLGWDDIDVLLCHQANRFMLDALRTELAIAEHKLPIDVERVGNLSTASLPVFISRWAQTAHRREVTHALAVGFGVGLSWGVISLRWQPVE